MYSYSYDLCILTVMTMYSYCMFMYSYPDWGFSVLSPQLWGKCQGKTRKDGARPAFFLVAVLSYVFFVLFYVFLCCSMYCVFCDVPCIVCVYMCTEQLPPGGSPIAVKYIILCHKHKGMSSTKMTWTTVFNANFVKIPYTECSHC